MTLGIKKILGAGAVLVLLAGVLYALRPPVGYNEGYQPDQPIPYDHAVHAGKLQIPCMYCHANADKSKQASVPSLNICMNCHSVVATDRPAVQKLREHYEKGVSVPWVKVHMLPDHAHFNHERHVRKGVACQECHGAIQEMSTVYQKSDMSMGWCIECHRKPENNAPINCSTCHY
ncbi:MAG: cytochrome C [Bdellovibrionales bacterium CG10_big_fil_rev_8_21_14_0_10_45_34]|nr:MAG: cytochrome C [Bdellovibrionales bacterium CG10_big_fil_rev_8_21_14_0_10_45_34]